MTVNNGFVTRRTIAIFFIDFRFVSKVEEKTPWLIGLFDDWWVSDGYRSV